MIRRVRAHAKINLDLRVLGRRADGYHDLRTIFQTLALHDTVVVARARGPFAIEGDASRMPLDRSNLVWRAADALWAAAGRAGEPHGARVRVVKRIPPQAGLGGGSSDAAAALAALAAVWRIRIDRAALHRAAAALGADVPFFLVGGTALGLGRGDEVLPLAEYPPHWVVLALPAFGVSTADAYAWLAADRAAGPSREDDGGFRNDFEAPVGRRHPELITLRETLVSRGAALARLSGSGSAVFGLFAAETRARAAARAIEGLGFRALVTRTRRRAGPAWGA